MCIRDSFKIGRKGFLNITGEFLKKNRTNRAGAYTGAIYDNDPMVDEARLTAANKTREDFNMRIGEAAAVEAMGSYTLELPIDDVSTFYSSGDLSHRNGN